MQIILQQEEILDALESYVRTQINIADGMDVSIDMKAGRGENGFTATLDIVPAKAKAAPKTSFKRAAAPAEPEKAEDEDNSPDDDTETEEPVSDDVEDKPAEVKKTTTSIFSKAS